MSTFPPLKLTVTHTPLPVQQLKQIGNAVPIPLGVALGKELGKALVIMWKQLDKIAEEEREASPEAETYESDAY